MKAKIAEVTLSVPAGRVIPVGEPRLAFHDRAQSKVTFSHQGYYILCHSPVTNARCPVLCVLVSHPCLNLPGFRTLLACIDHCTRKM